MKPYKAYKETGIDWLPRIPAHWSRLAMRFITQRSEEQCGNRNLELLSVYREYGVIRKNSRDDNHNSESLDVSNYKFVDENFLVINKMKAWQGSLGVSKYQGIVSPAYIVCKIIYPLDKTYLHFLLRSFPFKCFYNRISTGIRVGQWDLSYDKFKALPIYLPSLNEQKTIVKFIQDRTQKIDQYITTKQKEISVLEEYKQTIINEAVTKGLDRAAQMKDSGIEWIGQIPAHWEVVLLRRVTKKIGSGKTPTGGASIYENSGITFLRSQNIYFHHLRLDDVKYISQQINDSMHSSQVEQNDVLLNITGGSIGRCCVYELDIPANVNQHVCIIRPNKAMRPKYLEFLLGTTLGQEQIQFSQNAGNRESLTFPQISAFKILLPSVHEQDRIITYIERRLKKVEHYKHILDRQIELLNEYRTTLISDVVTGQVNVCESQ